MTPLGGNHDIELETMGPQAAADLLSNATYLQNTHTVCTVPCVGEAEEKARRVCIFGTPSSHGTSGNRGFQNPVFVSVSNQSRERDTHTHNPPPPPHRPLKLSMRSAQFERMFLRRDH